MKIRKPEMLKIAAGNVNGWDELDLNPFHKLFIDFIKGYSPE